MAWLQSFFGAHQEAASTEGGTILDVVTYLASLATNPSDIDPMLDTVREVSSRLTPGQALSTNDEAKLSKVYKDLELYLIEKDPIRKFTPEEVRRRVRAKFPDIADKLLRNT